MAEFIYSAFCDESGENKIEGQMKQCKLNGITHMELRGFGPLLNINKMSAKQAREMKKKIDAEGMKVASIGSGYGKINIKKKFDKHFDEFKKTVEVANILEAKYFRMFSFFFDEDDSHEEYRDEVVRRVKTMADYADAQGLICCHENEKDIYGDIPERCLELLECCDGKLRAVFDPANFVQCGVDTLKAFDMLKDHIEYMHIKDALFSNSQVVPAGQGDGNVKAILTQLNAQDREIVLSLEPHLQVFAGLSNLEAKHDTERALRENVYKTHAESFKVAADALKGLVKEIKA